MLGRSRQSESVQGVICFQYKDSSASHKQPQLLHLLNLLPPIPGFVPQPRSTTEGECPLLPSRFHRIAINIFPAKVQLGSDNERGINMGTHWIEADCINCATCAEVCPEDAISEQDDVHVIEKEICIDCGACDSTCPFEQIKWEISA
jgi:ferredoxin